jgi:hypothetical protein
MHVESVDGLEWATNHANTRYRGPEYLTPCVLKSDYNNTINFLLIG